jgi:NAD(P)H dehydrogenase (quinone)
MTKPTILVTAAAGNTGAPTVAQLREQGYPVRAMVRRADQRSERLRALGAEIVVGSMDNIDDVRQALAGVQRAYYCPPFSRDSLAAAMTFATVAHDQRLEMITVMSQWLADAHSPSKATRDIWLVDQIFSQVAIPIATVNPGWFADNYRAAGLEVVAQLGVMMIPLGEGLNAPPSNEDIARVVVGTLTNPSLHVGQTYRPTGPQLLSPVDIAETFGKVLGRRVRYLDVPPWFTAKVMRASGYAAFDITQMLSYIEEYKRNAFAVGAPTDVVLAVGGREPEAFEVIARRYLAANPNAARTLGAFARTMLTALRTMITPGIDIETYARRYALPPLRTAHYAGDSSEWVATHGRLSAIASDRAISTRAPL